MSVSPSPSHATGEQTFETRAIPIDTPQAIDNFISGSRQTLNHLKLAALPQILEARSRSKNITDRENLLHYEWLEAARDFTQRINCDIISKPVFEAIAQLTPRVGILTSAEIYGIGKVVKEASRKTMGRSRFSTTMLPLLEIWLDRALHINSALLRQQFDAADPFRIVQA